MEWRRRIASRRTRRQGDVFIFAITVLCLTSGQRLIAQTTFEDSIIQQEIGGSDHGAGIASGDANGDGHLDLAVADPGWLDTGRAWLLLGPDFSIAQALTVPNAGPFDVFGSINGAWTMADMNDDQLADLLMSSGSSSPGTGAANVGRALVLFAPDFLNGIELKHPSPGKPIGFGTSMVPFDVNGDGALDVGVGSPRKEDPESPFGPGRIDIYSGTNLSGDPAQTLMPPMPSTPESWGSVLLFGDWNSDGTCDVLTNDRPEGVIGIGYSWLEDMDPSP